jgi:hypothetical protein
MLKMGSDVNDGFVGLNPEHQDCCSLSSFLLYKLMWMFSIDMCYLQSSVNTVTQNTEKI